MTGKIQIRLAVLGALAALVAVLIPATLASGTHSDDSDGDFDANSDGVLRLQMNDTDGDRFIWDDETGYTAEQVITVPGNDCLVALEGDPLVTFDGTSPRDTAGYKDHGLGVKSGGSKGVACSRVSDAEELHLSLSDSTDDPLAELEVSEAQLDVEVKQHAHILATTYLDGDATGDVLELRSGDSITEEGDGEDDTPAITTSTSSQPIANCRNRADSGPDAGAEDNCRWIIKDVVPFDKVVFTVVTGEFTLEGGNDGTPAADDGVAETYGSDSLFFLTDIGTITCGETVPLDDDFNAVGDVTLHSMLFNPDGGESEDWYTATSVEGVDCLKKIFQSETQDNAVAFVPSVLVDARYTMIVTVENQPITVDEYGVITSLQAEYNLDGDLSLGAEKFPVQACNGEPIDNPDLDGDGTVSDEEQTAYDDFWSQEAPVKVNGEILLPSGPDGEDRESICFYHSSVTATGTDEDGNQIGTEVWKVYFEDDPGFFS